MKFQNPSFKHFLNRQSETDAHTDRCTHGQMHTRTDAHTDGCTHGRMHTRMDAQAETNMLLTFLERLRTHKVFTKYQCLYLNYHKFSIKSFVLDVY